MYRLEAFETMPADLQRQDRPRKQEHGKGEAAGRRKAFLYGLLSGIVEPIGGAVMLLLSGFLGPALPYLLAFAAGAMIYVVVEELIPEAQSGEHSNISTVGVAIGFVLMMILDVALG